MPRVIGPCGEHQAQAGAASLGEAGGTGFHLRMEGKDWGVSETHETHV